MLKPAVTSTEREEESIDPSAHLSADTFLVPPLGEGEVHVFVARLDEALVTDLQPLLSTDESERADRFVFPSDRHHFIVARGLLRRLLGGYLQCASQELQFAYGAQGKPSLLVPDGNSLRFNLAHSHGRAVYAFTRNKEVGIDLEFTGRKVDYERLAGRFFSEAEVADMKRLDTGRRRQAFFNCWTRKEAYIKARGEGLSIPLDEFAVSITPGKPAALVNNYRDADECSRWSMTSLTIAPGYTGALVLEGKYSCIRLFHLGRGLGLNLSFTEETCSHD